MVCKYAEYQVHHYADDLKESNWVLYYIKMFFFQLSMYLDHILGAAHSHDVDDETGEAMNFEDWAVSPWEIVIRDIAEVILWLMVLLVVLFLFLHLTKNTIRFRNFMRVSSMMKHLKFE